MAEGEEPQQLVIRARALGNGEGSNGGARQRDSVSGRVWSHGTLCYTKHLGLMTAIAAAGESWAQMPKASSPVMSRPMISVWISWVPS